MQTSRTLSFEGGCNFRDIGGYRTRDGRELKWGRVFRTGVLSYFTSDDGPQLDRLGVRAICDLRRADERSREPTRWPDSGTRLLSWDDGSAPPTIRSIAAHHPQTAAGMHAAMIEMYRVLPAWMAPRLRGMFESIAAGDLPLVIHCSAGKDRTGIAVALLLAALDVPQETIVEDYLLTNACDLVEFITTRHQAELGIAANDHPLLTWPEDIRRVLFSAHVDYLDAALDQIARDYSGVSAYLTKEVGLDDNMLAKLRTTLLTSV